jgi:hypothetical protein
MILGQKLKDDDVLEVLDSYQIENVIYDFDRLHENTADKYWAPCMPAGFQLGFYVGASVIADASHERSQPCAESLSLSLLCALPWSSSRAHIRLAPPRQMT